MAGVLLPSEPPPALIEGTRRREDATVSLGPTDPFVANDRATARRSAFDPPSTRRRVLVATSAAAGVAALALTVILWPTGHPAADHSVVTPLPLPAPTPAPVANAAPTTAQPPAPVTPPATSSPGVGGNLAPAPTPTSAPPAGDVATLVIAVDAPASITVDGKAQPPGDTATVEVAAGVEHVETVQRPGHSVRKLHVPALAPGEHMRLPFNVR
jgi:hypothetical protein